jgi:hypothetical protein
MALHQWVTGSHLFERRIILIFTLPLKIRTLRYFKTSVLKYPLAQLHIPEEINPHIHPRKNLKIANTNPLSRASEDGN